MTAESQARMAKATKIARALLAQCSASAWLKAGVAQGTDDFWLAAAQSAGVRPPSAATQALVVELITCIRGHELGPDGRGWRRCLTCKAEAMRRYRASRRDA